MCCSWYTDYVKTPTPFHRNPLLDGNGLSNAPLDSLLYQRLPHLDGQIPFREWLFEYSWNRKFIYVLPDHSVGGKPGGIIQGGNNLFITFLRFDKTNRYFLTQLSTFCRNI